MKLSAKQKLFVAAYLRDRNATSAAKAAGFSAKTARQAGARLLSNVNIQKAIETGLGKLAESFELTAEKIVDRIVDVGFRQKYAKNSDVLRACELLGKHFKFKLWTDVIEDTRPVEKTQVHIYIPDNGRDPKPSKKK